MILPLTAPGSAPPWPGSITIKIFLFSLIAISFKSIIKFFLSPNKLFTSVIEKLLGIKLPPNTNLLILFFLDALISLIYL